MACILLDVDGVLHVSGEPIPGAVDAVSALRRAGHSLRFVTNNSTRPQEQLAIELHEPMVRHFEAAQQAHRARDFAAALAHLHRVQEFAPQHVGTRKAEIPFFPRVGSVTAKTTVRSATEPWVVKVFEPFRTQPPLPSERAVVRVPPASLPAVGSVRLQAPIHSPVASLGTYAFR